MKLRPSDIVSIALIPFILAALGSCSYTAVSCWHRGGTVLRNAFDWPTCVEVVKR
jgi:hypothetical protein